MTRVLIAGDWHLGTYSAAGEARLARDFLDWARGSADRVVLNGDIFEGLFESPARAERAHPAVAALIVEMARRGKLQRTQGNHDPDGGALSLVLEHPAVGRVLVAHGHVVDAVHISPMGHFGDGISRRFGHLALVRGAAWVAEAVVAGTLAAPVDRVYRRKCTALVERERCALGVFGHNHRRYLMPGDRYANAGRLHQTRLEYLLLDDAGASLREFTGAAAESGVAAAS